MESDREREAWSFVTGLVLGGVIGAGVALLTTPQSGRRTRRRIRRGAKRLRGTTTHRIERFRGTTADRLDRLADELKGKVDEAIGAAREHLPG